MKKWAERLFLILFVATLFSLAALSVFAADALNVTNITQAVYSGQMQNSFLGDYGAIYLTSTTGINYGVLMDNAGRTYSADQTGIGSLKLFYAGHPIYTQNYTSGTMTITYANESGGYYSIGLGIPNISMSPGTQGTNLYYDNTGRPWFDSSLNASPAVNSAPTITLSNQAVNENSNLLFTIAAVDTDGDTIIAYDASQIPSGAVLNSTTGLFNWTPTYDQNETYSINFYANDSFSQGSTTITITVNNVNRAPVLNPIGAQTIAENSSLNFTISGSDPDGQAVAFGAFNLPANSNWYNDTGIFNWTPSFSQNGTYLVTFNISDGQDTASETVTITVTNLNAGPWFLSLQGAQTVNENITLTFTINATDPDNDALIYNVTPLPSGASIDSGTGLFTWAPNFTQNGAYTVDLNASDGIESIAETITITVNNVNAGPELAAIGNQVINENQLLELTILASDPDNNPLSYGIQNRPDGATFDLLLRVFNWTPTYTQNGTYTVTFNVTDGSAEFDEKNMTITVSNVNRAPTLNPIGNRSVLENESLEFYIDGLDPDGDNIEFNAYNLPEGAVFNSTLKLFNWTTNFTNNGTYIDVAFNVTDSITTTEELINITVENVNRAPLLNPIGAQTTNENQTLTFTAVGSDLDDDALVYYLENPPEGAAINPSTGVFTWTPNFTQHATYPNVVIGVNDSVLFANETTTITVNNVNAGPELNFIGDRTIDENLTLDFTISASDPDNDALTFSQVLNKPNGASFDVTTGRFTWTPDYTQAGTYFDIVFNVSDSTFWDSENISITVNNVNRRPVLTAIGDRSVNEGQLLTFTLTANDPDGDPLIYNASGYPAAASFDSITKTFAWTPGFSDAGQYAVLFNVTDGTLATSLNASETITITVLDINQQPILNPIGSQSGTENSTLNFTLSGSDPDGNPVAYEAYSLPLGANFDNVTLIFNWTPNLTQSGSYTVGFNISDGQLNDTEEITITISNLNIAPMFNSTPDQNVAEGQTLTFAVDGYDPDEDPISVTNSTLPDGAVFNQTIRTFNWTPSIGQNGTYVITFTITDGNFNVSMNVTITVSPVPRNVINSNVYAVFYQNSFNSEVTNAAVNNTFMIDTNITNSSGSFIVDINQSFFNESIAADVSAFWNCTLLQSTFIREECIDLLADNSYIRDSNTTGSTIINSTVTDSNMTGSLAVESTIHSFSDIDLSDVNQSLVGGSVIVSSAVFDSNIENSSITASNVSHVNLDHDSSILSSEIADSAITNSSIVNSAGANITADSSTILDSSLANSSVSNSLISNSTITNTTLYNAIANNSEIIDGVLYNGTIIFDGNETTVTEPKNLSDIINYYPVAGLSVQSTANTGDSVTIDASGTTDPNIPGELNDTIEYFFEFGDGTNYTENNNTAPDGTYDNRTTHVYSNAATYDIRVIVTDRFGLSDTTNTTIVISQAPQPSGPGGGGGGGGGGAYYPSGAIVAGVKTLSYETSLQKYSWPSMSPAVYKIIFKSLNQTITGIEFELKDKISNGKVLWSVLNSSPAAETLNESYNYLEIEATNMPAENLSNIKILFRVDNAWLNETGTNPDNVVLYRYTIESAWTRLITEHVKTDAKYNYYEALSPGFSYFAIGTTSSLKGLIPVQQPTSPALQPSNITTKFVETAILPQTEAEPQPTAAAKEPGAKEPGQVQPSTSPGLAPATNVSEEGLKKITGATTLISKPGQLGLLVAMAIIIIVILIIAYMAIARKPGSGPSKPGRSVKYRSRKK